MQVKKILLADDDTDDREIFQRVLGKKSNASLVRSMENGKEVIDYLNNLGSADPLPDLIVLDQNMPKMTGTETLAMLKASARYEKIKVAIYSTSSDNKLTQKCLSLGASAVLSKPSTMKEYEASIDHFLEILS